MPRNKKNIVLLGMMGAGKTSVAKKLSEKLNDFRFVDLDKEIEKSTQSTISEIFENYGEMYFRNIETQCACRFSDNSQQIISTGGGIVVKNENLDVLRQNGILFYLSASVETLYNRVKDETHRPLLNQENPKKIIETLLEKRLTAYKSADFEIKTDGKDIERIAEEIIEKYETRL